MKNCICLICHKPNFDYFNFLNEFTNYDIVVVIDDNSEKYYDNNKDFFDTNYPNLIIIQFDFFQCISVLPEKRFPVFKIIYF